MVVGMAGYIREEGGSLWQGILDFHLPPPSRDDDDFGGDQIFADFVNKK